MLFPLSFGYPLDLINGVTIVSLMNFFVKHFLKFPIDPYHNHHTGYKFVCTPGGVKDDNYRYDDSKVDTTWDGIWWAEGNIDSEGWTTEFKIPFGCTISLHLLVKYAKIISLVSGLRSKLLGW